MLEAGHEAFEDVRLHVAEGGLGPGGDPLREGLEDAALEVRTGVQGGDLGSILVADVVVADAQHVVLHARGHQGDLGLHELGDARGRVQGDGSPDPADAVLGDSTGIEEPPGLVGAVHFEAPAVAAELLVQPEVVEHRADVEQLRVEAQSPLATLQAAEEVHPPRVVVHEVGRDITDQLGGVGGQLRVGHGHAGCPGAAEVLHLLHHHVSSFRSGSPSFRMLGHG